MGGDEGEMVWYCDVGDEDECVDGDERFAMWERVCGWRRGGVGMGVNARERVWVSMC